MAKIIQNSTDEKSVTIPLENIKLEADLTIPANSVGIVIFAHGSGSSRKSPRNKFVANKLNTANLATLLIDLLTSEEEKLDFQTRELRFNIDLLTERISKITDWIIANDLTKELPVGYFGASTGAAAALKAAAKRERVIKAVVSRGGRPDLAEEVLEQVHAPALLIVGSEDLAVIGMNELALKKLRCEKKLEIVKGATHLFEEPGTLDAAADLAKDWFIQHLTP